MYFKVPLSLHTYHVIFNITKTRTMYIYLQFNSLIYSNNDNNNNNNNNNNSNNRSERFETQVSQCCGLSDRPGLLCSPEKDCCWC